MSCDDCVKGVKHDGVFEGQLTDIGGIKCYVSTPKSDFASTKAILFLSDGFGITLINNQLIIDDFARNGFKTIAPDILFGDPVPEDFMSGKREFSFPVSCLAVETYQRSDPFYHRQGSPGAERRGYHSLGRSWILFRRVFMTDVVEGRYCFDLAFENIATVVVVNHPSLLESPKDLEKYAELSRAPLLINSCTHDQAFPLDAQEKADEICGSGKFSPGYRRSHWEGCTHGFAVRGDMNDPQIKAGKEGAFKEAVLWFKKYL